MIVYEIYLSANSLTSQDVQAFSKSIFFKLIDHVRLVCSYMNMSFLNEKEMLSKLPKGLLPQLMLSTRNAEKSADRNFC